MFAKNLHLFFLASHIYAYMATPDCQRRYIRRLNGYLCVSVKGPDDIRINDTQIQRCNYECMRRTGCTAANYNALENICLVNEDRCTGIKRKPGFEVTYFGRATTTTACLSWVPQRESNIAKAITATRCYKDNNDAYPCYVGRLVGGDNTLPAAFVRALNTQFSVFNNDKHTDGEGQVLQVQPECDAIWVMFDATTDPLPPGAIKEGYMAGTESDLYLMRARHSGWTVFGYFNPATSRGYYFFADVAQETQSMNILVFL